MSEMPLPDHRDFDVQTLLNIRDARGLSNDEKVFLYTVEMRGIMKSSWERAAADMGMKKTLFYDTRARLLQRGLILRWLQPNGATWYITVREAIALRVPVDDSGMRNEGSVSGNGYSAYRNGYSAQPEQKRTTREQEEDHEDAGAGQVVFGGSSGRKFRVV